MAISFIGYYSSAATRALSTGYQFNVTNAMVSLFLSFIESSYVYYAWKRGIFVLKREFPRLTSFAERSIYVILSIILVQSIPNLVLCYLKPRVEGLNVKRFETVGNGFIALSGLCVIAFDLVLLSAFIQFVRKANVAGASIESDKKLVIVCRYGIGAIATSLTTLAIFVLYFVTGIVAFNTVSQLVLGLIFALLLGMKVSLFHQEIQEAQNLQARITGKSEKTSYSSKLSGLELGISGEVESIGIPSQSETAPPLPNAKRSTVVMSVNKK
ncbi:hypothetical protein BCR33DRAFT_785787 [Rhizoclosmatium globosum]|uniref:Uncharacterized protein n=1 Tax=Rhizoclosmatium globosum TaxID=329046 RepID=A0A1Y2CAR7_9FUNG|nr:hypothetical protein BCR33DRAFT_785787 [Rhizoclosmatium globosum]|eukprot:ORY43425.1 hypothetical protein BCR33DRAFT_785787 [Rhizoclosmatium globosum]